MTAADRLTVRQQAALGAIDATPGGASCAHLAAVLSTSKAGAATTASSLVRRGLAVRVRRDGHVLYAPNRRATR